MNLDKKISRYRAILQEVKNWPSFFLFKTGIGGKDVFPFRMRNGMQIGVNRKMLGPFRECFFDNQYYGHPFLRSLPANPFILDVGANVGFAALHFFYHYPGATVHSFEPMPFCIRQIRAYQGQFPPFKWILHPYGLWSKEGELEFFTQSSDQFSTTSGINPTEVNQQKISINVRTLDSFFSEHPGTVVDLLKMDCEGAEYEILFNMDSSNLAKIQRLVMETHRTEKYFTKEMAEFLRSRQFEVEVKEGEENGYIWARKLNLD